MRVRLTRIARRALVPYLVPYLALNAALGVGAVVVDRVWFGQPPFPAPHLRANGAWSGTPVSPDPARHAVIVSGGISPQRNHARYWNNVSLLYCVLRERGWGDIEAAMSDGRSAAPDQLTRSILGMFGRGAPVDGSRDLDGDGAEDITEPGTHAGIRAALERVGRRLRPGDELFVFLTDHGQLRRAGLTVTAVALLWGEELRGADLDRMLRETMPEAASVTILATQCHSKRFLDEVTRPGTTLMASGYPLWIYSDQYYSVFPYKFCEELLGRDPVSGRRRGVPASSLADAFARARARAAGHTPEWPQMWSVPTAASRLAGTMSE